MRNIEEPIAGGLFRTKEHHSHEFDGSDRGRMFKEELAFSFSPTPNPHLDFCAANLGSALLWKGTSTGHEIQLREPEMATVLFPRRCMLEVEAAGRRLRGGSGDMVIFTPNERKTQVIPDSLGSYACNVVMIPTAHIEHPPTGRRSIVTARRLEGVFREGTMTADAQALATYCRFLFHEAQRDSSTLSRERASDRATCLLIDLVAELIDTHGDADDKDCLSIPAGDARLVRLAEDIMREHFAEPLSIHSIACSLGVTQRRLQYAFRRVLEEAPRTVLLNIRLDAARKRLRDSSAQRTVITVAHDCGITHAGRFASVYARRFGEKPSETMRKRRSS